jgi:hypothetical protein
MSFDIYSQSGGAGNQPYAELWVVLPDSNLGLILNMGGTQLNDASAIHVVYTDQSYWGQSLGSILNDTYEGVKYGDMTVEWVGVGIGDWAIDDSIGKTANIDSITVSPVPEPTTMIAGALLLLPFGASTLRMLRKKRMAGLIGVGALALGLLASGGSAKANLIVNGSFELGGFVPNGDNTMDLPSGSTAMTGWTVTTANLAWIGPGNPFGLSASDGSYFLDLSGYHDNQPYGGVAASTGISTVIGQQYNVAFDVGSDVVYDTVSPSVQVTLNGNPPAGTFTAGPIASVHNRWETFDFAFTATSVNTVITFQGVGADNQKYIGLDNVVVSTVPEPTTMIAGALLLLPFGASTLRILRKSRTA